MSELPTTPSQQDYHQLDRYLMNVFRLLEGIADIDEANQSIREFLDSPENRNLDRNLENLLYDLFFAKCRKYYTRLAD